MDRILRDLTLQDIELVREWRNSEEVSAYMYTSDVISIEQQLTWYKKISDDESCKYWIIQHNETSIGLASITGINYQLNSCYWAFYLGNSSIRGSGIGAKVELSVINYVFNTLNLNKLRCEVFSFNDKVIKMHEKFGFRREAYYRQHCFKNGEFLDVVGLALLKQEWLINQKYFDEKFSKNY